MQGWPLSSTWGASRGFRGGAQAQKRCLEVCATLFELKMAEMVGPARGPALPPPGDVPEPLCFDRAHWNDSDNSDELKEELSNKAFALRTKEALYIGDGKIVEKSPPTCRNCTSIGTQTEMGGPSKRIKGHMLGWPTKCLTVSIRSPALSPGCGTASTRADTGPRWTRRMTRR